MLTSWKINNGNWRNQKRSRNPQKRSKNLQLGRLLMTRIDDEPVKGTRSLYEIYESSNIAIYEHVEF